MRRAVCLIFHSIDRKIVENKNDDFSILLSFSCVLLLCFFSGGDYVPNFLFLEFFFLFFFILFDNYSFPTVNIPGVFLSFFFFVPVENVLFHKQINSILLVLPFFIVLHCMPLNACLYRLAVHSHSFTTRMSHKVTCV